MPPAIFVLLLGCCVGSFLNVVHYRMPRQLKLLKPPSSCPLCNHKLKFFTENLPVIGWFLIGGKCYHCKAPVSKEYPIIEALTGLMFLGVYVLCYWVPQSTPFFGEVFGSWWHANTIFKTLPMFLALVTLCSGLLSMTIIDARTFTIPIQIPNTIVIAGVLATGVQSFIHLRHTPNELWPYPLPDWTWSACALGGMAGVLLSTFLLRIGVFKYSFADYEDYVTEDHPIAEYPHARREMFKELFFLMPIITGILIGFFAGYERGIPPLYIQAISGSLLGYLVGGGLVWAIRIFGTLAFGREAMGLGDVHLLGGVGAILGWFDPILIFFIAPFSGLIFVLFSSVLEKIGKTQREIPYGPHLAVATIVVVFCRPLVQDVWQIIMPNMTMP
ncbi:MAG: prepilin peptidase [Planctomycetota bacterium]|nr:prepilin peptidase [Planctomycetota bacterium]